MNRFGAELHPDRLRWAAAEGVSGDVIARPRHISDSKQKVHTSHG
jgi:hypothetical protein